VRPGDRGETVARVQRGLLSDGADLGPTGADGVFGSNTAQAVMDFKRKYKRGFEQFADVGPGTMAQLDALCPQPGPTPLGPQLGPTPCSPADISKVPKGLHCPVVTGAATPSGTNIPFATNTSSIMAFQPEIDAFVNAWVDAGAQTAVSVDGYASETGPQDLNWTLSCDRASTVKDALVARGIPESQLQVRAHGETCEFDQTNPLENQRVVISAPGISPAPVPPAPVPPAPPFPVPGVTATLPLFINGASTPPGMDARIPPRVATIVPVTIAGPVTAAAPVRVSIDGAGRANGSATINGVSKVSFATAGTFHLALKGVDQSFDPGNLMLVARLGATVLAATAGFSVASIPVARQFVFHSDIFGGSSSLQLKGTGWRGVALRYTWRSDSGDEDDLDLISVRERVQETIATGHFKAGKLDTSDYIDAVASRIDTIASRDEGAREESVLAINQTFQFADTRTGVVDVPMAHSGLEITRVINKIGDSFMETSSVAAAATTALGVASEAAEGKGFSRPPQSL
jgi:outer membrane protein OmpA-like peptidoglycan-associated protein